MRQPSWPDSHRLQLRAATVLWLLCGAFLLLTTLVPMHSARLGWTPAFWLLGAPLIVLLGLQPELPRRWLVAAARPRRRRTRHQAAWH